jgi:hypothetical protein
MEVDVQRRNELIAAINDLKCSNEGKVKMKSEQKEYLI